MDATQAVSSEPESNGLTRALLAGLLAILGFLAGTIVGARFVPPDSGLAGPAIALGYGLLSFFASLAAGVLLGLRLKLRATRSVLRVLWVMLALAAVWLGYRLMVVRAEPSGEAATAITEPTSFQNMGEMGRGTDPSVANKRLLPV